MDKKELCLGKESTEFFADMDLRTECTACFISVVTIIHNLRIQCSALKLYKHVIFQYFYIQIYSIPISIFYSLLCNF